MKQNAMTSIRTKPLRSAIMALALIALMPIAVFSQSSINDSVKQQSSNSSVEQELTNLSKQKWQWMSERKVDSLDALFHEQAVFVHMGATMAKRRNSRSSEAGEFNTRPWKFRKRQCGSLIRPPSF